MMRVTSWGTLAVVGLIAQTSQGQFASDRPLSTQPAFGGASAPAPIQPGTPVTPRTPQSPQSIIPAGNTTSAPGGNPNRGPTTIPTTIDPNNNQIHPWSVKPNDGEWMILVKAYMGPNSRSMAERFVKDLRDRNIGSFLFERNAVERRAELAQIEAIRQQERAKAEPFLKQMEQARKEAEARGHQFIADTPKIKIAKPYRETEEQWAVLIGGFPTMDAARKGLNSVHQLQPPKDVTLLDQVFMGASQKPHDSKDEEWREAANFVNPFKTSMVVPNPAISRAKSDDKGRLEPFVVHINEDNPFSLLKARKPWTLIVRSYSVPMRMAGKDGDGTSVFDRLKTLGQKKIHDVTAEEAERFAMALTKLEKDRQPMKLDAFVLHHRTGSIVTVGQFNAIDDPELLKTQQILMGLTFEMKDRNDRPLLGRDGKPEIQRMFDSVSPFPVPKP